MNILTAALLLVSPGVSYESTRDMVDAARPASQRYDLPDGLLVAVAIAETGGRNVVQRRTCGGYDVGAFQIHTHDESKIPRLKNAAVGAMEAAKILDYSRKKCARRPRWRACKRSIWSLYNARSTSWWTNVKRAWDKLKVTDDDNGNA